MLNVVMLSVVAQFCQSFSGTLWLIWHKHHLTEWCLLADNEIQGKLTEGEGSVLLTSLYYLV
jgi:hypothetical protein